MLQDSNDDTEDFDINNVDDDCEVRPQISVNVIKSVTNLGSLRFAKFSEWKRLVEAIACLKRFVRKDKSKSVNTYIESEQFIIKEVQSSHFNKEIQHLQNNTPW